MDSRGYTEKMFDCGIMQDEIIRINPRMAKITKVSDNEVLWDYDNCTVRVTADGSGDTRENFKAEVMEK